MESVSILGAGHQGLTMAAHLLSYGTSCVLWNRSERGISDVLQKGCISAKGLITGDVAVYKATTDIEEAIARVMLVATPSSAHEDIARLLAPYVSPDMTVVLNPGRTFGAAAFAEALVRHGVRDLPLIAETQTIVYTCRRGEGSSVDLFAFKHDVPIKTLQDGRDEELLSTLPPELGAYFAPANSIVETSFGNVGMVLHCAPMLMNVGWVESSEDFLYYRDAISDTVAKMLEKVDSERLAVAARLGCSVESLVDWLKRTYGASGSTIKEALASAAAYESIIAPGTMRHRYVLEDVPNGLVPLESTGNALGVETPTTSAIVSFANEVYNQDFRKIGRNYEKMKPFLNLRKCR